ncbi:putative transcription factor [Escovopsis weberi]|uniref:Putative transcription factor n=1 Tax=Escovopsis weberi TaxID=150374 RepID=A0A0M8N609_ESCWE|nr:putative transcription factor [Escovopsis weberi]
MPYNTNAIPPRKEPTGQAQLPLSRVKKIISQDPDIQLCSNNAAFVITLAAGRFAFRIRIPVITIPSLTRTQEMFIQHLADEAYTQAKLERKPRRNIQYKDIANAISHHDNLEFLEDVAPKTVPFRKVKALASAAQARVRSEATAPTAPSASMPQSRILSNGHAEPNGGFFALSTREGRPKHHRPKQPRPKHTDDESNAQLELEMRQAARPAKDKADIDMTG